MAELKKKIPCEHKWLDLTDTDWPHYKCALCGLIRVLLDRDTSYVETARVRALCDQRRTR